MPTVTMAPPKKVGRQVRITVLDANSKPAQGARLEFAVKGIPHGSVLVGEKAQAGFQTPDANASINVFAEYGEKKQDAYLPPGKDSFEFRFDTTVVFKSFRPPIARCPDGTTGQPCVDCEIDGQIITICS
jgi:hypothetical protein